MNFHASFQITILLITAFSLAFAIIWLIARYQDRNRYAVSGFMAEVDRSIAFLFEDEQLINATEAGHQLLSQTPKHNSKFARLVSVLATRFDGLESGLSTLAEKGTLRFQAKTDASYVDAEWRNGLTRLSIVEADEHSPQLDIDHHGLTALEHELDSLRATTDSAPFLVWRQSKDGAITWANNAYLQLVNIGRDKLEPLVWPPEPLFNLNHSSPESEPQRASLHLTGEAVPRWFDYTCTAVGDETLYTAIASDRMVKAETSLREFVQTLTKTFAHLTVGLAIFDKQRQLTLFNPALMDLTGIAPDVLSSRPTLTTILDKMRENRMIPEPKNYISWRQRLVDLEAAATNGTFEETWPLPSGKTFRVIGRPHPDGAVAFILEDISADISSTRRFRAQIETGQAIIDSMDEAIAVFSPTGELTSSNQAYGDLWGGEPSQTAVSHNISEASNIWSNACAPTPIWGYAIGFVRNHAGREKFQESVMLKDGRQLYCRVQSISGGETLVGFSINQTQETLPTPVPKTEPNMFIASSVG